MKLKNSVILFIIVRTFRGAVSLSFPAILDTLERHVYFIFKLRMQSKLLKSKKEIIFRLSDLTDA